AAQADGVGRADLRHDQRRRRSRVGDLRCGLRSQGGPGVARPSVDARVRPTRDHGQRHYGGGDRHPSLAEDPWLTPNDRDGAGHESIRPVDHAPGRGRGDRAAGSPEGSVGHRQRDLRRWWRICCRLRSQLRSRSEEFSVDNLGGIPSYGSAMTPGVAFVFPGQGSQVVGMGREFYDSEPVARTLFEQASQVLGYDVAALCLQGPAEKLNFTEYTQPALLTVSVVALRLLERAGLRPSAVAGHSLGEYTAVVAAGGLPFPDGVALVRKRGRYMQEAVEAGRGLVCALLGLERPIVTEICRAASAWGVVAPANFNAP